MILLEESLSVIRKKQGEGKIHRTPTLRSESLSRMAGGEVFLKLEALQKTGSFKIRGAYFAIHKYVQEGYREFVTASSGNHAQGVAYAAQLHNVKATVVMPENTPWLKVKKTQDYGASVLLHGESYYEAEKKAAELAARGVKFLHAYDDYYVISGQATLGVEILEDVPDVDMVVVPIGGGGLISGIAYAIKKIRPSVKIVGVQASGAPAAYLSLREGKPVVIEKVDTIADGIAVKRPGDITFNMIQQYVDDIVLVDDNEIVDAIFLLLERTRVVAEGAGAVATAAIMSGKISARDKKVVAVISGGNIDAPILMRVLMKALARQRRVLKLIGEVPDRPGTLAKASSLLAARHVNILEVYHERYDPEQRPYYVRLVFVVEVPATLDIEELLDELGRHGFHFTLS